MAKAKISAEIKVEVQDIVDAFNRKEKLGPTQYQVSYRGKYLYLKRDSYGHLSEICRLEWKGEMDNWGFAIYKYSRSNYDPDEWFFPGSGHLNGTIVGAMIAVMEDYSI